MSRENRLLLMYFVGVVLLFTYFRIQFPNSGRIEEMRPVERSPEISVLVSESIIDDVEKVARSYELEFGIRVLMEPNRSQGEPEVSPDLFVGEADPIWSDEAEVVHEIRYPAWRSQSQPERGSIFRIGIASVSDARRQGAARFGRYLVSRDRGLPLLLGEREGESNGDLWNSEPTPRVVVWEGLYPALQNELRSFDRLEGVSMEVVVGDCAFLERNLSSGESVDGVIGVGEICWANSEEKLWEELVLFDSPFVFLSSIQAPSVFDPDWETTATSRLLGLRGALGLFSGGRAVDFIPVGLRELLESSEAEEQVRVRDLVLGIQSNPNLIGFAVGGDYLGNPEGIRLEPLSMAGDPPSVRLLLSKQSNYQHLLARLGAVLAEAARTR